MNPKPRPNEELYLEILRRMSPEQKLRRVFELTELTRRLFLAGIRHRHPSAPEAEIRRLYLEGLAECHNQNY